MTNCLDQYPNPESFLILKAKSKIKQSQEKQYLIR